MLSSELTWRPARDPAQDGGAFVVREIVPGLGAQIGQHLRDRLFIGRVVGFLPRSVSPPGASCSFRCGSSAPSISGGNFIRRSLRTNSSRRAGISPTGKTQSTIPVLIAVTGMLSYSASFGSCAIVTPPWARTCFNPIEPSESLPEKMTETARCP